MALPPYKPRKDSPVSVPLNEPIEFSAIDWYECDLSVDTPIERKESYLNQDHNKTYTILFSLMLELIYLKGFMIIDCSFSKLKSTSLNFSSSC